MQGDKLQRWRTEPFIMITGSGRWVPPPLPTTKSQEHEKESTAAYAAGRNRRLEPERTLTDPKRDEFEDMLRALTLERSQIKEAMGFSLDNADAAGEIVEVLTESLTLKEMPIPTKVARLMLVSDILHNSSATVKNASAYRTKFEATLPHIMESFNDLYRSVTGRITAEALKERVLKVLQVWSDWFLFSDAYVNGLRATFLRSGNSGVAPFHSICGYAPEFEKKISSEDAIDGIKTNQDAALAMGKGAAMRELMDLPLAELERHCRHNGLSLVGGREIMVARLLSLEDAEKLRNYELDDELKYRSSSSRHLSDQRDANAEPESLGLSEWTCYREDKIHSEQKVSVPLAETFPVPQPELKAFTKKDKIDPVLPASKWAREDDNSDEEEKRSTRLSSGSENADDGPSKADELEFGTDVNTPAPSENAIYEEKRQKLRRLEVALIEYRESLEERGIKNAEDIERRVTVHRKRLESEYGLTDSGDGNLGRMKAYPNTSLFIIEIAERRDGRDDALDSARKRHHSESRSESPPWKASNKKRDRENSSEKEQERHRDKSRDRDRGRSHDPESERGRDGEQAYREKSGSRERDEHDRDRGRERDRRRRIN